MKLCDCSEHLLNIIIIVVFVTGLCTLYIFLSGGRANTIVHVNNYYACTSHYGYHCEYPMRELMSHLDSP